MRQWKLKIRLIWYLTCGIAIAFVLLTIFVVLNPLSMLDRDFSQEVQEHHNLLLDRVMNAISWFGYMPGSALLIAATALLFLAFNLKREALFVALTAISGLLSTLVKLVVNRPRPLASMVRILGKTQQQSFPSGHVLFYIVFFGFLTLLMYRLDNLPNALRFIISILSVFLIVTVPISRIYLGAHWFTDVLGGSFLGLLLLALLSYAYLKPELIHRHEAK